MDTRLNPLREAVQSALGQALADHDPGALVTRWSACVEVLDPEGDRAVWLLAPEDARAWDTLGLLAFATQMVQADVLRREED